MNGQTASILILAHFATVAAVLIGWVLNLIDLIGMIGQEISTEFILRIVGVPIVPLGSIMGYFA